MTVYDPILAELKAIRVLLEQRLPPVPLVSCSHKVWNGLDTYCPGCGIQMVSFSLSDLKRDRQPARSDRTQRGRSHMNWIPDMIWRLESLSGPDRAIDAELWQHEHASCTPAAEPPPHYTGQIDAARTLIHKLPGSMRLATTFAVGGFIDGRPHGGWAKVYQSFGMAGSPPDADPPDEAKDCASPAIALCVAALRARRDMR